VAAFKVDPTFFFRAGGVGMAGKSDKSAAVCGRAKLNVLTEGLRLEDG